MLFLSKLIIMQIFYRFKDHTTNKNSSHETSQTSAQSLSPLPPKFIDKFDCNG